ncbi:gluconate kinase, SKI family [Duganella sp. CF458]|uniref:gluconokinase n=1 Tax=Duganella sp. CF458 TaxID=1884368 RepID=UPI0008EF5C95|nr:gluconokinase [Duganella sp. CF458]SFF73427.1 gluconate kinase, SKI family [Duganella sp. CF458]
MKINTNLRVVVMGVSGAGKSEIGRRLAAELGVTFLEGDSYHPPENLARMSAGIPLNDDDRAGWLQTLRKEISAARERGEGLVLSCSSLKRRYRDLLRSGDPELRFVYLHGERDVLEQRMHARPGHYMPASLLDSQLRDLEPLQADEAGIRLDLTQSPQALVDTILQTLQQQA